MRYAREARVLTCVRALCTHAKVIIVFSTKKMSKENPSRSSKDNQTLFQDDVDEILREELTQPSQGNDSLPNMLTSINDTIVHMTKSFSTLSETRTSFIAEQGKKRTLANHQTLKQRDESCRCPPAHNSPIATGIFANS